MNGNKSEPVRFPHENDHLEYQKALRARASRHQNLTTPPDVVNYLVVQIQSKYRKGHRHVEAKIGFPLDQIDGLVLESDGLVWTPGQRRQMQLERLNEIFLPLLEQAFDAEHLLGQTTVQIHGKGATLKAEYQVSTPKQYRH